MVLVGPGTQYQWAGCGADDRSHRLTLHPISGFHLCYKTGALGMIKDFIHRTWRIAVTVGPLVAIALTLAAGMKWR